MRASCLSVWYYGSLPPGTHACKGQAGHPGHVTQGSYMGNIVRESALKWTLGSQRHHNRIVCVATIPLSSSLCIPAVWYMLPLLRGVDIIRCSWSSLRRPRLAHYAFILHIHTNTLATVVNAHLPLMTPCNYNRCQ